MLCLLDALLQVLDAVLLDAIDNGLPSLLDAPLLPCGLTSQQKRVGCRSLRF